MDVKLRHFITRTAASIFNIDSNLDRFADFDLGLLELQIRERELRITEAVAERIKRRRHFVPVTRLEAGLRIGLMREVMCVIDGNLSFAARPGDWQFAARIG